MTTPSIRPPASNKSTRQALLRQARVTGVANQLRGGRGPRGRFHEYRGFFLLACGALALWLVLSFVKPVVMGAIFAAVLYPFMLKMAKWRVSSTVKATVVTLGFMIAFLIPIGILIGVGGSSALEKLQSLQTAAAQAGTSTWSLRGMMQILGMEGVVDRIAELLPFTETQIRQVVSQGLQRVGAFTATLLQNVLADLPGLLLSTIVILFTIFYLLIDGRRAVQFVKENSFFGPAMTDKLLSTVHSLCYSTVVATIVAGAVQTTLLVIACLITGTPNVLLIALVTFIFSFLPMVGTAPVTLFLTAQAFFSGEVGVGITFLVSMFVIGFSDNFVRPYVLRGGANVHPLVGFVAAFGGLDMIGFYGLFIGPVVVGLFFHILPLVTKSFSETHAIR